MDKQTVRDVLDNLIYKLYVNKNESKTQREEDDKNEKTLDDAIVALFPELSVEEIEKILRDNLRITKYQGRHIEGIDKVITALSKFRIKGNKFPECVKDCETLKTLGVGECESVCPKKFKPHPENGGVCEHDWVSIGHFSCCRNCGDVTSPKPLPPQETEKIERCGICGTELVWIRGKYPNEPKRKVCANCLQSRLERVEEISSRDYGKCYTDKKVNPCL